MIDVNEIDEKLTLPSSIMNPYGRKFRRKTRNISSLQSLRPKHMLVDFPKNPSEEEKTSITIEICRVHPLDRTMEEILILIRTTVGMSYFVKMNSKERNRSENVHERCCAVMKYEFLRKGEVLFFTGDLPTKFFLILKGSVNVFLPKSQDVLKKEKGELRETLKRSKKKLEHPFTRSVYRARSIRKQSEALPMQKPLELVGQLPEKTGEPEEAKEDDEESQDQDEEIKEESTNNKEEDESDEEEEEEPKEKSDQIKKRRVVNKEWSDKNAHFFGGLNPRDISPVDPLFEEGVFKYFFNATLKAGAGFGELGLLRGKPRSATIICKEDCHFGIMFAEDYKCILSVIERKKLNEKFQFFRKHLLGDMNNDTLMKISYSFEKKKLLRNEILFEEGEISNHVYLLKKGDIKLLMTFEDEESRKRDNPKLVLLDKIGKRLPIKIKTIKRKINFATLSPGEFFAEEDIFESEKVTNHRTYTAIAASSKVTLYYTTIPTFQKFLIEKPQLSSSIKNRLRLKLNWREHHIQTIKESKSMMYNNEKQTMQREIEPKYTTADTEKNSEKSMILPGTGTDTSVLKEFAHLRMSKKDILKKMHEKNDNKKELSFLLSSVIEEDTNFSEQKSSIFTSLPLISNEVLSQSRNLKARVQTEGVDRNSVSSWLDKEESYLSPPKKVTATAYDRNEAPNNKISSRGIDHIEFTSKYLADKFRFNEMKLQELKRVGLDDSKPFIIGDLGAGKINRSRRVNKRSGRGENQISKNSSELMSVSINRSHMRNNSFGKHCTKDRIDKLILSSLKLDDDKSMLESLKTLDETMESEKGPKGYHKIKNKFSLPKLNKVSFNVFPNEEHSFTERYDEFGSKKIL